MMDSEPGRSGNRHGRVVTFYSYKGGTGRTMTLANVAWILAANGARVLTVDWDLEAPGLSRFFHPFLDHNQLATTGGVVNMINDYLERAVEDATHKHAMESGHAAVSQQAISLDWDFPGDGCIDFISAGRQNEDYSTILNGLNWDQFYQDYEGGTFLDALREEMARGYDYTFIDSRTGLSDSSKICTQHLPDDLVVCFTLSDQSIDGAAGVARLIDNRTVEETPIRILPVPMRIDEGEKERVERGRAAARARFQDLPKQLFTVQPAKYWGSIEIPYRAFYAYEEVLATFGDAPGLPNTVLDACERLAKELTQGKVQALPEMPEALRTTTLAKFVRKDTAKRADFRFQVWYAIEDQMWADWVRYLLDRAGYQVAMSRIDGEDESSGAPKEHANGSGGPQLVMVPLLTPHFLLAARSDEIWGTVSMSELANPRPRTAGLRLGTVPPGAPAGHSLPLDLTSPTLDAAGAVDLLVRHVGGEDEAAALAKAALDDKAAPRFPGTRPAVNLVSLQSRNSDFTGRADELVTLRETLVKRTVAEPTSGTQALHGLGGVGKSQLAREYAYRYMADYDLIWWIPSEDPALITTELAVLAERLGIRASLSESDAAKAVVGALAQGTPYSRWLLIFDNAEDPGKIKEFLPGGEGHVIITSRSQVWSREATELQVEDFSPEESIAHLSRRVPNITEAEAGQLAEVLGGLPLAVEQAAAFLELSSMSVEGYIDLLRDYPDTMFGEAPPADYPMSIAATFAVSLERLEAEWPAARRLLQMSVFLGPEPFSQKLLHKSPEMLAALSARDERLRRGGAPMLGRISHAIRSLSLAKVDGRKDTIQVHRMVQARLRMLMTDQEQADIRTEVQLVLAGQRPQGGEVEDPENRQHFERIRPHLAACSAESSEYPEVRQLMIDLVRLHWRNGDYVLGRNEADRIDAIWSRQLGEENEQTLALRTIRANFLRDLGEYGPSFALDERTWKTQVRLFGEEDPSTLVTARGMAGGMRALGRYQDALERDLKTYEALTANLLEEDRQVLNMTNNLAIDYRLIGNSKKAQEFDERTEVNRRQVLGPEHERTLQSQLYLARDKRDSGELRDAAADLERLLDTFRRIKGDDHPETLRTAKSLAVSLRVLGHFEKAATLSNDTYARFLKRYGKDSPDTWQCALNVAADDWCAGHHVEALRRAEEIWDRFIRALGRLHPNALACSDNVAVYLRTPDATTQSRELSAALGEEATAHFTQSLGPNHPFTMCAEVNWANARAELGDLAAAEASERSCLVRLAKQMGEDHPDTHACRSNLAVTLKALGQADEAQRIHDHAVRALTRNRNFGPTHPDTVMAEKWVRISHILELQAW
jgi:MinD-like ATPase involved in chromosome partitioning or flagellar assembly/tetratricopeptide (TPR) repeat protein